MKIQYTLDDSAARLPLAIRSADGVWDRAADLRGTPGIQLVELTTQHMLNTGATLYDELAYYFDNDGPTESDPYALAACYADRAALEDLLDDLRDMRPELVALYEVAEMFPLSFEHELPLTLALTTVGVQAFGYVRTFKDSEGEEYHGLVVNLAQARPHLENTLGHFSRELLLNMICYGFFNHEAFLLAYQEYCEQIRRVPDKLADRVKDALLSRGIAWYLSYRHNLAFYDEALGLNAASLSAAVARCNAILDDLRVNKAADEPLNRWLHDHQPGDSCIDIAGYLAARTIAQTYGDDGLRAAIARGPDHFIAQYNALSRDTLTP